MKMAHGAGQDVLQRSSSPPPPEVLKPSPSCASLIATPLFFPVCAAKRPRALSRRWSPGLLAGTAAASCMHVSISLSGRQERSKQSLWRWWGHAGSSWGHPKHSSCPLSFSPARCHHQKCAPSMCPAVVGVWGQGGIAAAVLHLGETQP